MQAEYDKKEQNSDSEAAAAEEKPEPGKKKENANTEAVEEETCTLAPGRKAKIIQGGFHTCDGETGKNFKMLKAGDIVTIVERVHKFSFLAWRVSFNGKKIQTW